MTDRDRELAWLRRVHDLSHRLAHDPQPDQVMAAVLDAAIEVTQAERGFLVVVRGAKPSGGFDVRVEAARGFDGESLRQAEGKVSRTVVQRVLKQGGRGVVTSREDERSLLQVTSVEQRRVLSIMGLPLRLRGEVKGVLYLDHRFQAEAFGERDLELAEIFADQAALALDAAQRGTAAPEAEPEPPSPIAAVALAGGSPAVRRLRERIRRAARQGEAPVLLLGETGTGKEAVARAVHAQGPAPTEPFLTVKCGASTEARLEQELFGDGGPGAGLLARAGRGAVYLERVADLSAGLQARLLSTLEEQRVRPAEGGGDVQLACRIFAATPTNLREHVRAGSFREDLYYRLDVLRVEVPPLRERREDVPELIARLTAAAARPLELTPKARELLQGYSWPGNLAELQNELVRLASRAGAGGQVSAQALSDEVRRGEGLAGAPSHLAGKTLAEVEREMVRLALESCGGNKARAARQLGIPRSSLYDLLARYGLS